MDNQTKVLLRKDWQILKRSWLFLLMFTIVPILMMTSFWYLKSAIEPTYQEEKHNTEHSRYGTTNVNLLPFQGSDMSKKMNNAKYFKSNVTAVGACRFGSRRDIGIITPKGMLQGYEKTIKEELSRWQKLNVYMFNSQQELFDDIATNQTHRYCFAFEMSMIRPDVEEVNVTIYFPRDDLTGLINTYTPLYDLTLKNPDWFSWNRTFLYGTPHFMMHLTDLLVWVMAGHRTKLIELAFIPMKSEAFNELPPTAASQLAQTFPIFFICIYLLPLYYLTTRLAEEKESKAREGMKMMGLRDRSYYQSYFLLNLGLQLYVSLLVVGILQMEVFADSSATLILLMCLFYGTQTFGFSITITSFFSNKKASATAASILHLSTYYFIQMYKGYGSSFIQKALVACFVPNCALGFMLDHLLHCELEGGAGLNLQTASLPYQSFTFISGLQCQLICSLLWALIGIYLDKVMPREFGRRESWNFLWKSKNKPKCNLPEQEIHDESLVKKGNFEKEDYIKGECLKIRGLNKVYKNGFQAVKNTSMTMYKGQIFALLGHNGAGKTTTIGMLTGLLDPTDGQAQIGDLDIFQNVDELRKNLGVCPQHNVLFGDLTVREHLELFLLLKGPLTEFELLKKVDKMIYQIELTDVQFQLAATLSGGQKRKLSVGIALIGDAKIIMLDEPTSGMDTTTRRRFWDIIKLYKNNRIIILTTHYMDEADELGDRICIMGEGKVQCCGSSLFLKNRFGVGYRLTLNKTNQTKVSRIKKWMSENFEETKLIQDLHQELIYQIPEFLSQKFKYFYQNLDKDLQFLELKSYSVSITTLEEVFLKIGHGQEDENTLEKFKFKTVNLQKLSKEEKKYAEYSIAEDKDNYFYCELKVLIWKKLMIQIRDFRSCLIDLVLPCCMIVLGIWASQLEVIPQGHPVRALTLYDYPPQKLFTNFQSTFQDNEGMDNFRNEAFQSDQQKIWLQNQIIQTNTSQHFFDQIKQIDEQLFTHRLTDGPFFAQPFIQEADSEAKRYSLAALVNASQPTAALSASSYLLQSVMRSELKKPRFRLNFLEAQLPFGMEWQVMINTAVGMLSSLGFAISFMMISDTLIQALIKEKQLAIKHQIVVSGGSKLAYWLSHYIVDIITHSIPAVLTLTSLDYWNFDAPKLHILFIWFVFVNPLFIYTTQFGFKNDGQASVFIRVFYFALGGVAPIAMQVLRLFNSETNAIADYLQWYFRIVPIYNINIGYISIINRWVIESLNKLPKNSLQPLDWRCAGEALYFIQNVGGYAFLFLLLVENNILQVGIRPMLKPLLDHLEMVHLSVQPKKLRSHYTLEQISKLEDDSLELAALNLKPVQKQILDSDPLDEEERVKSLQKCALKVDSLSKAYTPLQKAVDNLSFALDYGECFALLGITGAGKTTTFKCLCQEEIPDSGSLYMGGHDVRTQFGFHQARQLIGYCPQFDALYDHLTVFEHLYLYATLKGVNRKLKNKLIELQIKDLDLENYQNVQAGQLSGGNKRKLSCAIALIGNPPIILLDEPSTGVDPQAKRFMWTVISNISTLRKKSTVILTTHSMEEAEALCPKMGIMVDGRFKCFGSAQHIKDKYADGFNIEIKLIDLPKEQLQQMLEQIGQEYCKESEVFEREIEDILGRLGMQEVLQQQQEITFKDVFKQEQPFPVTEVLRWAHLEYKGIQLVKAFEQTFDQCQVISHFANRFSFKVPRKDKSIGFVFGFIESLKEQYQVQSYSATQTTLEQIFNMFAQQKGNTRNRD